MKMAETVFKKPTIQGRPKSKTLTKSGTFATKTAPATNTGITTKTAPSAQSGLPKINTATNVMQKPGVTTLSKGGLLPQVNTANPDIAQKPMASTLTKSATLPQVNTAPTGPTPGQPMVGAGGFAYDTDLRGPVPTDQVVHEKQDFQNVQRDDHVFTPEEKLEMGGPVAPPPIADPTQDPLIEQMKLRTQRENIQNTQKNRRDAHERAIRAGFQEGSPQYEEMMRNAETQAKNQNIAADNKFREFATGREDQIRSRDFSEDMATKDFELRRQSQEFGQEMDTKDMDFRDFNNSIKFVESDIGRSLLAGIQAEGGDWSTAMNQLYTTDADGKRVLHPMHKDKTSSELIKASLDETVKNITVNPEGADEPWGVAEREAWVSNKVNQIAGQGLQGLDITSTENEKTAEDKSQFEKALEVGDFNDMSTQRLQRAIADDENALEKMDLPSYDKSSISQLNDGNMWSTDDMANEGLVADRKEGTVIMYGGRPLRITSRAINKKDPSGWAEIGTLGGAQPTKQLVLGGVYLDEPGAQETDFYKSARVTY